MNIGIVNEPKISDNLKMSLVNIENGYNNRVTEKREIYEDILRPLLQAKECINEWEARLVKKKSSGYSIVEINPDILKTLESTLIKGLNGLQKHFSLGNIEDKYKNHSHHLKNIANKLIDGIEKDDNSGIWTYNKTILIMNEPITKLADMLKYDFGFKI